jgi:hypothetical protein
MSVKDRIRIVENKLAVAATADGKILRSPDIDTIFVRIKSPDAPPGAGAITTIEDSVSAKVEGVVYIRKEGETFEAFKKRVDAHPRSNRQIPRRTLWTT